MTLNQIIDEVPFIDEEVDLGDLDTMTKTETFSFYQNLRVKSKLERALTQGLFTDLTCLVGQNEEEVKCHSLILRLHSVPFDLKYMQKSRNDIFSFPAFSPAIFKKFLLFLYTDKLEELNVEDTISLMQIGSEFKVESLLYRCAKFLKDHIDIHNSSGIYTNATEFGVEEVRDNAYKFIIRNTADVFKTDEFLSLSLPCLRAILTSDTKNVDQVSAFNGMIRWAEVQCEHLGLELTRSNLQTVLEGCETLINYNEFTAAEFSENVVETGVLSEGVALQILKKLLIVQKPTVQDRSSLKLSRWGSSSRRSNSSSGMSDTNSSSSEASSPTEALILFEEPLRLQRYPNEVGQEWITGGIEKITFMVKTPISLSGIVLFGRSELTSTIEPLPIRASMTLSTSDGIAQIASSRKTFPGSVESRHIDFLFETPISLEPKRWYSLLVETGGEVCPIGTWSKKKVKVHLGCNHKKALTVRFQHPKGISARTRTGQFPSLLFTSTASTTA